MAGLNTTRGFGIQNGDYLGARSFSIVSGTAIYMERVHEDAVVRSREVRACVRTHVDIAPPRRSWAEDAGGTRLPRSRCEVQGGGHARRQRHASLAET